MVFKTYYQIEIPKHRLSSRSRAFFTFFTFCAFLSLLTFLSFPSLPPSARNRYCISMATIILKSKEDIRIRRGHPWIYDNEIARVEGEPEPGGEVEVRDARGLHVGYAFFNPNSKIRARIYSRTAKAADEGFFVRSFETAREWRRLCFGEKPMSLRLVYGEADSVPGLIVYGFLGRPLAASDKQHATDEGAGSRPGLWLSAQVSESRGRGPQSSHREGPVQSVCPRWHRRAFGRARAGA
jgi:Predicted SAM-dependent methyltransferases